MDNKTGVIIIIAGVILIVLLLLILLLLLLIKRSGSIQKRHTGKSGAYVTGKGLNIYLADRMITDTGLKGFGEDNSGTLLTGGGRKSEACKWIYLISLTTGIQYACRISDLLGVGRQNVGYAYREYLEITEDPTISKVHAEIIRNGRDFYLRDIGSANHSWVNGQLVTERIRIKSGDILTLANSQFEVQILDNQ